MPSKLLADDARSIMVAVAGEIADLDLGVGDGRPDQRSISLAGIGIRCWLASIIWRRASISLLLERLADLVLVDVDAGGGQVAEHLADHVLVAGFLEIGVDDVLGIGIRLSTSVSPICRAAHSPSSRLRRAVMRNCISSSRAYFASKARSRSSN